jgi:glycosidase
MVNTLWYKNAVFYEVYVRGFKDSSSDGNGDLNGLIQKTDYLHELGIDCLWLLPIYPSPLIDDGYDISDYYSVLPDYGTLEEPYFRPASVVSSCACESKLPVS